MGYQKDNLSVYNSVVHLEQKIHMMPWNEFKLSQVWNKIFSLPLNLEGRMISSSYLLCNIDDTKCVHMLISSHFTKHFILLELSM